MSLERLRGLEVDIDTRLSSMWQALWDSPLGDSMREDAALSKIVGDAVRVAYGQGYTDALREEAEGRRGELQRAHGYRTP